MEGGISLLTLPLPGLGYRAGRADWSYKVLGPGNPGAPPTQAWGRAEGTEDRSGEGRTAVDL